ncbi:MAG: spermidine synthase [Alteromonas naphthalenivorans]|jgi:spermidine synthase
MKNKFLLLLLTPMLLLSQELHKPFFYPSLTGSEGLVKHYVVEAVLEDFTSKMGQHIQVFKVKEFGKALFIDGDIQVSTKDEHLYSSTFVNSSLKLSDAKNKVAIIGGGDGGVARECLSQDCGSIDWYDLDQEVIEVSSKHLSTIGNNVLKSDVVTLILGDAFKNIKSVPDNTYDKLFIDLTDDQFCVDLTIKNMDELKRILKPNSVVTVQASSKDTNPAQVEMWTQAFEQAFGNTSLDEVYIPSFDCAWNFLSSVYRK